MTQTTRKEPRSQTVRESVEQVWLAGLGALALTEEEGTKFFRSLVKKGEVVERQSRARFDGAITAAKRVPTTAITKLERRTDDIVETVMHRLGVPTRRELTGLTKRIEGLASTLERKPRARRASRRADTSASGTSATMS